MKLTFLAVIASLADAFGSIGEYDMINAVKSFQAQQQAGNVLFYQNLEQSDSNAFQAWLEVPKFDERYAQNTTEQWVIHFLRLLDDETGITTPNEVRWNFRNGAISSAELFISGSVNTSDTVPFGSDPVPNHADLPALVEAWFDRFVDFDFEGVLALQSPELSNGVLFNYVRSPWDINNLTTLQDARPACKLPGDPKFYAQNGNEVLSIVLVSVGPLPVEGMLFSFDADNKIKEISNMQPPRALELLMAEDPDAPCVSIRSFSTNAEGATTMTDL